MSKHKSERTAQMMKHFMELKSQGYSNKEIAGFFQISIRTIYTNLDEIAKLNGVNPDSLRERPHQKHGENPYRRPKTIQSEELGNLLDNCLQESARLIEKMNESLNKYQKE